MRARSAIGATLICACGPNVGDGQAATSDASTGQVDASSVTVSTTTSATQSTTGPLDTGSGTTGGSIGLCLEELQIAGLDGGAERAGVADFDGDGRFEVWTAQSLNDSADEVSVFAVDYGATATVRAQWMVDGTFEGTFDLDGDALRDLLTIDANQQRWALRIVDSELQLDGMPIALSLPDGRPGRFHDANADGPDDALLIPMPQDAYLTVAVGDGDGGFAATDTVSVEPLAWPEDVLLAGPSQFAVIADNGSIGFGLGWGVFTIEVDAAGSATTIGVLPETTARPVDARDRNGDGRPDLLLLDRLEAPDAVSLALSGANEDFEIMPLGHDVEWAFAGDFLGDGTDGVLVTRNGGVQLWLGAVDPTSEVEPVEGVLNGDRVVSDARDLDADGADELVVKVDSSYRLVRVVECES